MKFLKLLLVFGLLCKTTHAEIDGGKNEENEKRVSFSVEKLWQSYRNKLQTDMCPCVDESWKEGIQEHYDGCRAASWTFRGKAYNLADIVVNSFQAYVTKLIYFANSNSTIVTSSSTAILRSLSRGSKLNRSSMNIMVEFEIALPAIIEEFNEIATKLSDHIGDLACVFTTALSDLGSVFFKFMRDFLESCRFFKCKKRVNYSPVLKQSRKLMNTLALIGETLLNECESEATQEVFESVFVLHLLYFYLELAVPGIHSCVMDVLYDRNCLISKSVKSSALSFEYALVEVTQSVSAVVFPFNKTIKDLMRVFVNITMSLNTAVKGILGLFDGVEFTVEEIAKNLVYGDKIKISADKGHTKILKGVAPE